MDNSTEKDFDFNNWGLSKAWQLRFKFYEENGLPKFKPTAQYTEKFKALSFGQRFTLTSNIGACFFGPLYFLCVGMWRKAIVLWLLLFTIGFVILAFTGSRAIAICVNMAISMTIANPAYYLHRVKKSKSFNIFEGLF
ncbi:MULTISPECIES: DUF2628 domain-containing protein [Snodgrassella]|uniref:DUF2628 domain-containing protein n=1 Tax=Snodgrassella TaxID=1193515 RepID=UPI0008155A20|nr:MULTISPECIES: DUF2628 domain-containing protein [Snodgrassella]SCB82256.1 Protein of unknown function [Snodgrassella sp. R-53583]